MKTIRISIESEKRNIDFIYVGEISLDYMKKDFIKGLKKVLDENNINKSRRKKNARRTN